MSWGTSNSHIFQTLWFHVLFISSIVEYCYWDGKSQTGDLKIVPTKHIGSSSLKKKSENNLIWAQVATNNSTKTHEDERSNMSKWELTIGNDPKIYTFMWVTGSVPIFIFFLSKLFLSSHLYLYLSYFLKKEFNFHWKQVDIILPLAQKIRF